MRSSTPNTPPLAASGPRSKLSLAVALAGAAALAAPGISQDPPGTGTPGELEVVDQEVADIDPLSTSLREMQTDLRRPSGFSRVYRVPGREDLLMRIDGALYAVFPRSQYAPTRAGTVPMIPNNTVFHIGMPDEMMLPPVPFSMPRERDERDPRSSAATLWQRLPADAMPSGLRAARGVHAGGARSAGAEASTAPWPGAQLPPPAAIPEHRLIGSTTPGTGTSHVPGTWGAGAGLDRTGTGADAVEASGAREAVPGGHTVGAARPAVVGVAPTVANDPLYRAWRLRELLLQAARGSSSSSSK